MSRFSPVNVNEDGFNLFANCCQVLLGYVLGELDSAQVLDGQLQLFLGQAIDGDGEEVLLPLPLEQCLHLVEVDQGAG